MVNGELILGDCSIINGAFLEHTWIRPEELTHKRITVIGSNLTECDLTLMHWSMFRQCRIEGGRLPIYGNYRDAFGCIIMHEDFNNQTVLVN